MKFFIKKLPALIFKLNIFEGQYGHEDIYIYKNKITWKTSCCSNDQFVS